MLTRRAPLVTLIAVLICIGTTGCVSATPTPSPSADAASPSPSPLFASDEEALAAATEAYAAYLELGSVVASEGGIDAQRMASVTVDDAYEQELATFQAMSQAGQRGVGVQTFDSVSLQTADLSAGSVSLYLCLDTSGTQIVDGDGRIEVETNRVTRFPLQVEFKPDEESAAALLVSSSESWTGDNFC